MSLSTIADGAFPNKEALRIGFALERPHLRSLSEIAYWIGSLNGTVARCRPPLLAWRIIAVLVMTRDKAVTTTTCAETRHSRLLVPVGTH